MLGTTYDELALCVILLLIGGGLRLFGLHIPVTDPMARLLSKQAAALIALTALVMTCLNMACVTVASIQSWIGINPDIPEMRVELASMVLFMLATIFLVDTRRCPQRVA